MRAIMMQIFNNHLTLSIAMFIAVLTVLAYVAVATRHQGMEAYIDE
jgi:hypothetical protein